MYLGLFTNTELYLLDYGCSEFIALLQFAIKVFVSNAGIFGVNINLRQARIQNLQKLQVANFAHQLALKVALRVLESKKKRVTTYNVKFTNN